MDWFIRRKIGGYLNRDEEWTQDVDLARVYPDMTTATRIAKRAGGEACKADFERKRAAMTKRRP